MSLACLVVERVGFAYSCDCDLQITRPINRQLECEVSSHTISSRIRWSAVVYVVRRISLASMVAIA
jgi:hypothetical protein